MNLNRAIAPHLAIGIADSSLVDDLGAKRMLYEEREEGYRRSCDTDRTEVGNWFLEEVRQ